MEEPAAAWPENLESFPLSRGNHEWGAEWSLVSLQADSEKKSFLMAHTTAKWRTKSELHLHLFPSNPLKSSPSRGPNHPEFARNAANQTPAPAAWRGPATRFETQEGKNSRGGAPREGGGAAALDFGAPVEAPEQAAEPGPNHRPQLERGKASRHQSAAREGEGSGRAGADRERWREKPKGAGFNGTTRPSGAGAAPARSQAGK